MRDYILTQSIARDSTFAFPKLRRIVRSWVLKRNLKALEALDAHLLDDIGLAREDLMHLHALPLDADLAAEFSRLRDERSRRGQHAASEQRGHGAVKVPEPPQPLGIVGREGPVGLNLGSHGRLGANARASSPRAASLARRAAPKAGPVSAPSCSSTVLFSAAARIFIQKRLLRASAIDRHRGRAMRPLPQGSLVHRQARGPHLRARPGSPAWASFPR